MCMGKYLLVFISIFLMYCGAFAQKMSVGGNVQDTAARASLPYASVMVVRLKDSVLIAHTRTDENGFFSLKNLPIDTVTVIVSHPKFGDQSFYIFGSVSNYEFDFGKIILPPKSQALQEIVIYAYKDPVYYKGDTLIYTADSFKVKPNATVEDLLKKLPGIKVDAEGKITAQGKKVDQVLVDGDEFFGSDPTVATQNLNAKSVESVQVYEKKNDQPTDDGNETIKVMNLKLKEDAKKGYFGKASAAGDFQKFYEGELLANKFNNKQKISVFSLASNTPRSSLGWGDMFKYGLNNEMSMQSNEDGQSWYTDQPKNIGIPRTLKSGVYYTDKLTDKTKISANYTYNNNELITKGSTHSQYFLTDTSYSTQNTSQSDQMNSGHNINFDLNQKIDSLTDLQIIPKLQLNSSSIAKNDNSDFINSEGTLVRRTEIINRNTSKGYNLNTTAKLTKRFNKKGRILLATYNNVLVNNSSDGKLISNNTYYNSSFIPSDSINQEKINASNSTAHNATMTYTEPLNKKISLELAYDFNYNKGTQSKQTFDFANGEYSVKNTLFTNGFENFRTTNRLSTKFIYEVKKQRFVIGTRLRQVTIENTNLISGQKISETVNNVLPLLNYRYKFSDNKRLNFSYATSSSQPGIDQLQPVQDNTNPNQIRKGNPNLLPTFKQDLSLNYSGYKAITGNYIWASVDYTTTANSFTNTIEYDSIGRTITTPVNVNGNYSFNGELNGAYGLFSRVLVLEPELSYDFNSYSNFINKQKNVTTTSNTTSGLSALILLDTLTLRVGYRYTYNSPTSTINAANSKPYTTQNISADFTLRLPLKFLLESDVNYTINSKRAQGYNINYLIWNASLKKTFFKNENLIVSIDVMDILNQNISASRTVQDNVITDNKTNIIARYILLKAVFKFNSNKVKEKDEMDF
jgi:hypothetical protein